MEIEKLIERLHNHDGVWCSISTGAKLIADAATTLEQLQAENDRLRRERDETLRLLKRFAPCAGCNWYRGIKGCGHEIGCDPGNDRYEFEAKEE